MARIALDATALHGRKTGIGAFTEAILARLAESPELDMAAFAVTFRGRGQLGSLVPPGVRAVGRPMAARPLRWCWKRGALPPVEWFIGAADLVHGPNFVVPPGGKGVAEVVTIHDLTALHFPELCTADVLQWPPLLERALARGAWVHAVSGSVADEVREAFPTAGDRVVAIPNGVDPPAPEVAGRTDAAAGRHLAGGDRYVLALGTVEPRKDLPSLVAAFDALATDDPDLRLVIAGPDGWGADALTAARDAATNRRRIVRLGWVSDDQRAALLRGASVVAYPSRYEGFGLVPLEALAVGTPVVATAVGALPEVLGDAAPLVPPSDPDALAEALHKILTNEEARTSYLEAGKRRVEAHTWEGMVEGVVALYQRALEAR